MLFLVVYCLLTTSDQQNDAVNWLTPVKGIEVVPGLHQTEVCFTFAAFQV